MITLFSERLSQELAEFGPIRELAFRVRAGELPTTTRIASTSLAGLVFAHLHVAERKPFLIVLPTEQEADNVAADMNRFGADARIFPWWGAQPYSPIPASSTVPGRRTARLNQMLRGDARVIVTSLRAFLDHVPPPEYFSARRTSVVVGQEIDPPALAARLAEFGYSRVPTATVRGEFSLRGEVLDIVPPEGEEGYRVIFEFDQVEDIRVFDPALQSSSGRAERLDIYPLREVVWDEESIENFRRSAVGLTELSRRADEIAEELRENPDHERSSVFYPLSYACSGSLLDYLGDDTVLVLMDRERLESQANALFEEFEQLYRQEKARRPVPRPRALMAELAEREAETEHRVVNYTLHDPPEGEPVRIVSDPPRSFFGNIEFLKSEITNLSAAGWRTYVFADTDHQAHRIRHLLQDVEAEVIPSSISAGFAVPDLKLLVIHEHEIFGRRKRVPASVKAAKSSPLDTFVELEPEDYVVHVNYGIGKFKGIERLTAAGNERDYIRLEYAGEEFVFIPIEQVNLIQRYIGSGDAPPRLDRIGGKSWENRKSRVRKSVEDLAEMLIELYSRRKKAQGFKFPEDGEWQTEFEASFPYEETEDQVRCIEDVKADMESPTPMDRLICGDVGYGKTEVALRAAFKAVSAGKQVAFLAPTTILAEQHYETARERLGRFPVHVEMLSRFVSKADQRRVLSGVVEGTVDMIVGTHRLLQRDVRFKDLGLIIVDEEQRFGVKDKERLKQLKTSVDCLTLTATPIPRTLHMSLLKIRDMSVLRTPPHNRLPIETVIKEFDEETVAAAIRREIERGGQVYFLHNRVDTLRRVRQFIEQAVPEAIVGTAHGQMSAQELEDVMHRFVHGGYHVLVATTIIENGLDIPNVNTIVIDRADIYGISQLYQLRGRVGRSDRLAYAYLFYPNERALSEVAMKRLQVVGDYTELGSGFKIALKDLEVRGAGNLLGRQQSGDILSVGFDMYLKLLDEAVRSLSDDKSETETEVFLDLDYAGYIPDSYVSQPAEKMEVYKKIAAIDRAEQLESVHAELEDRFGPLPDEVQSLLSLAEIRVLCRKLNIARIQERRGTLEVEFAKVADVSVDRVLGMIETGGGAVRLDSKRPNVLLLDTGAIGLKEKSEFIRSRLSALVA